jgi:16S rRNA processing protein RimM
LGDDVVVGRVVGVFGIRGEVKLSAADPNALTPGLAIRLLAQDGAELHCELETIRPHQRGFVARLSGIADADAARRLSGATIVAARADLPKLALNQYRDADLRGMQVVDTKLGDLGVVQQIRRYPACDMLVVGEKQILIPMLRAFAMDVDAATRTIRVSLPDGFEELI